MEDERDAISISLVWYANRLDHHRVLITNSTSSRAQNTSTKVDNMAVVDLIGIWTTVLPSSTIYILFSIKSLHSVCIFVLHFITTEQLLNLML